MKTLSGKVLTRENCISRGRREILTYSLSIPVEKAKVILDYHDEGGRIEES